MNDSTHSDLSQDFAPDDTTDAPTTNGLADLIGHARRGLVEGDEFFRQPLNALPAAVYATDADGFVERDGMHTTDWGWARSYRMPFAASASTTGVRASVPPLHPSVS